MGGLECPEPSWRSILVTIYKVWVLREKPSKMRAKSHQKAIQIYRGRPHRGYFLNFWRFFEDVKKVRFFCPEKIIHKSVKIRQNVAQDVSECRIWAGLAECAGPSGRGGRVKNPPGLIWKGFVLKKLIQNPKNLNSLIQHALRLPPGGAAESAARAFRRAFLSRGCWWMPPNREPWKLLSVYSVGASVVVC